MNGLFPHEMTHIFGNAKKRNGLFPHELTILERTIQMPIYHDVFCFEYITIVLLELRWMQQSQRL